MINKPPRDAYPPLSGQPCCRHEQRQQPPPLLLHPFPPVNPLSFPVNLYDASITYEAGGSSQRCGRPTRHSSRKHCENGAALRHLHHPLEGSYPLGVILEGHSPHLLSSFPSLAYLEGLVLPEPSKARRYRRGAQKCR